MSINNIDMNSSIGSNKATSVLARTAEPAVKFQDVLSSFMSDAEQTQAVTAEQTNQLLTGEVNNLHEITIANTEAELTLNLAIQVRNKVIDAYNEVMRMQV